MDDDQTPSSPALASLGDISQQAARGAQRVADETARTQNADSAGMVVLPGGKIRNASEYLDHAYLSGDHTSIFADPSRYIADVDPDAMYVWAAKKDAKTYGMMRSGSYVGVKVDELRTDTDLPFETHTVAGEEVACVYDLVLCKVPAKAVKRLYKWREAQAVLRTANNLPFQNLKKAAEDLSGGKVTAEMDVRVD